MRTSLRPGAPVLKQSTRKKARLYFLLSKNSVSLFPFLLLSAAFSSPSTKRPIKTDTVFRKALIPPRRKRPSCSPAGHRAMSIASFCKTFFGACLNQSTLLGRFFWTTIFFFTLSPFCQHRPPAFAPSVVTSWDSHSSLFCQLTPSEASHPVANQNQHGFSRKAFIAPRKERRAVCSTGPPRHVAHSGAHMNPSIFQQISSRAGEYRNTFFGRPVCRQSPAHQPGVQRFRPPSAFFLLSPCSLSARSNERSACAAVRIGAEARSCARSGCGGHSAGRVSLAPVSAFHALRRHSIAQHTLATMSAEHDALPAAATDRECREHTREALAGL